jgi:hypothetical protein
MHTEYCRAPLHFLCFFWGQLSVRPLGFPIRFQHC